MTKIEIELSDLEQARDALNTAHYKSLSEDMHDSYRKMDNRGYSSPLTKHFEKITTKLSEIIQSAYDQLEVEDNDESISE